jgi:hypothetical protein
LQHIQNPSHVTFGECNQRLFTVIGNIYSRKYNILCNIKQTFPLLQRIAIAVTFGQMQVVQIEIEYNAIE